MGGAARPVTILFVRHAVAKARHRWDDDDELRPLTSRGRAQAEALVDLLANYGITRVLSSPSVRCIETVEPLAAARALSVEVEDALAEGHGKRAAEYVRAMLDAGADVALCSHGDVIPDVVEALGFDCRWCAKGSVWVLDGRGATYVPPPE